MRICERAHSGLISAKAERAIWSGKEVREQQLGKGFWWAKGHEALEQDWAAGDFSTWIDEKVEVKAFGVSFDFEGLSALVPADQQAAALRRISVFGNPDWISASDIHSAIIAKGSIHDATQVLAEACRLGHIGARAMRVSCKKRNGSLSMALWQAMEWDVPLWFWRDFTGNHSANFQWQLGKVQGEGRRGADRQIINLQGLHFHRSGLLNLGLATVSATLEASPEAKRGRKPEYDWQAANAAIWGMILRGELIPENQAQIERAFQSYLTKGDKEPSESTVRPHAKVIWDEFSKA